MFSRTTVAFLLPLLLTAVLLSSCSASLSSSWPEGSGLVKTAQDLEDHVGDTVGRVQSGVTVMVEGWKQVQSGVVKISDGKDQVMGTTK